MATLRQLRDRVKSLKNTQQITRAMKMVAGARIRRAELAMRAARPYSAAIGEMLREVSRGASSVDHPLLRDRPVTTPAVLLMTADKGLAGAFNANLARAAQNLADTSGARTVLYTVGTKGAVMLRRSRYRSAASWPLGAGPFVERAREISRRVSSDFLAGSIDAMTLVSSRFVSTIVQRPTTQRLLPVNGAAELASLDGTAPRSPFEFEPDARAVLASLLPKYLEFTIFAALLETQASEFAARLLAMSNATDNAGKLIDDLTLVMNKTRQAAITKEILEIVGGAEAQRT
ncbi:MAG: ATP synthase F1 subunit gamma [Candidatus Eremiobacteraeota bacterium]|nr:ATP synthase F1 subunit gamma [Candidatus Eremiobacteraeota bacterium]MBC5828384.1 ATP synthase F1 subunit gamma [Candidatus Eremiobacteraeota bacterium]